MDARTEKIVALHIAQHYKIVGVGKVEENLFKDYIQHCSLTDVPMVELICFKYQVNTDMGALTKRIDAQSQVCWLRLREKYFRYKINFYLGSLFLYRSDWRTSVTTLKLSQLCDIVQDHKIVELEAWQNSAISLRRHFALQKSYNKNTEKWWYQPFISQNTINKWEQTHYKVGVFILRIIQL